MSEKKRTSFSKGMAEHFKLMTPVYSSFIVGMSGVIITLTISFSQLKQTEQQDDRQTKMNRLELLQIASKSIESDSEADQQSAVYLMLKMDHTDLAISLAPRISSQSMKDFLLELHLEGDKKLSTNASHVLDAVKRSRLIFAKKEIASRLRKYRPGASSAGSIETLIVYDYGRTLEFLAQTDIAPNETDELKGMSNIELLQELWMNDGEQIAESFINDLLSDCSRFKRMVEDENTSDSEVDRFLLDWYNRTKSMFSSFVYEYLSASLGAETPRIESLTETYREVRAEHLRRTLSSYVQEGDATD